MAERVTYRKIAEDIFCDGNALAGQVPRLTCPRERRDVPAGIILAERGVAAGGYDD